MPVPCHEWEALPLGRSPARHALELRAAALSALICGTLLCTPSEILAQTVPSSALELVTLADGIHLFRAPYDIYATTNAVVVINDDDVTVFDSNTRPSTARAIITEIRKLTPKPVRVLINSHWHVDHWSGNDVYARAFPGIQIVATAQTRDYMKRTSSYFPRQFSASLERRRAALDSAIRTGRNPDGSSFSADARRRTEAFVAVYDTFATEMAGLKRVFPTLVYSDSLTFWRGTREFRPGAA